MTPAGWYGDPAQRHAFRYWDGSQWTEHVADGGVAGIDPLSPAPAQPASPVPAQSGPAPVAAMADAPTLAATAGTVSAPAPAAPATSAPDNPFAPPSAAAAVTATPGFTFAPTVPAPATRKRGPWFWAVPVIAAVAVLGLVIGLLVWAPWRPPPLLQPAGLKLLDSNSSSVTFRWSPPDSGPAPDRYLILRNGTVAASLPGTVTSYLDTQLAPASPYAYQVVAVRGGKRSVPSARLRVTTVRPPLSAALLNGTWNVGAAVSHGGATLTGPRNWAEVWQSTPQCGNIPCDVTLSGSLNGHHFTVDLGRQGGTYSGSTTANVFPCGRGPGAFPVRSNLTFQIRITGAEVYAKDWQARSWDGTMQVSSPYTVSGSHFCLAAHRTIVLSGTL